MILVDNRWPAPSAKVNDSVDYYMGLRSRRAADRADVALVVCDAQDGVTSQDLRVAQLAMESGCATALVLNKWDITEMDEAELIRQRHFVASKLRQRPPVLTASALTGRHVDRLLREALALGDRITAACRRPRSNRWLGEVTQIRQPPLVRGKRLKLIYGAQIETRPPRFSIQVNSRKLITRDYAYFLENRLRERFGLTAYRDPRSRRARKRAAAAARSATGLARSGSTRTRRCRRRVGRGVRRRRAVDG